MPFSCRCFYVNSSRIRSTSIENRTGKRMVNSCNRETRVYFTPRDQENQRSSFFLRFSRELCETRVPQPGSTGYNKPGIKIDCMNLEKIWFTNYLSHMVYRTIPFSKMETSRWSWNVLKMQRVFQNLVLKSWLEKTAYILLAINSKRTGLLVGLPFDRGWCKGTKSRRDWSNSTRDGSIEKLFKPSCRKNQQTSMYSTNKTTSHRSDTILNDPLLSRYLYFPHFPRYPRSDLLLTSFDRFCVQIRNWSTEEDFTRYLLRYQVIFRDATPPSSIVLIKYLHRTVRY